MQFSLQTIDQLKPLVQGFRKRAGLTQAAMAEKLGITQQSYAQIESNLHSTSVERLYTILRLLNVELSFSPSALITEAFVGDHNTPLAHQKNLKDTYAIQEKTRLYPSKSTQTQNSNEVPTTVSQKSADYISKKPKAKPNSTKLNSEKSIKAWPQPIKQSDKTKW